MKSFLLVPTLVAAAFVTTGCGDMTLGDKVQLQLNPELQTAQLTVEMSDGLQVNMLEGSYPIGNGAGQLIFIPATKTENARLGIEVSLETLAGGSLDGTKVTTLPNGSPFPVAIAPPLTSVSVYEKNGFDVDALLSVKPELQLAATIGVPQMNTKYVPAGIAICQNFRNDQSVAFAAICIYGPGTTSVGGIFIGANLGDVLNLEEKLMAKSAGRSFAAVAAMPSMNPIDITSESFSWENRLNKVSSKNLLKAKKNVQKIFSSNR